jgi:polysaccharide deacetylase 2 family uncharacterized protein YibQ
LYTLTSAILFFAGCETKKFTATELRQVTNEIVAAAQRATQHKMDVAIRPEFLNSRGAAPGGIVPDNVYVTLGSAGQAKPLAQALDDIARRHKLRILETSSGGILRFDFSFQGIRTHTVHAIMPVAVRSQPPAPRGGKNARLVIIIDDLGHDRASADAIFAMPFALTVSVLPHLPYSTAVAEEAYRRGDQVLLHLPMESEADGAKPEHIELHAGMNSARVEDSLAGMLDTVPHAVGVNNHQGSRATSDPALMAELMPALHERGLFFIDSRTTAATVAYDAAKRAGVPAASRKVFLDDTPSRDAILAQLNLAARDAQRDGFAIAIGHPHPATLAALAEGVPHLEARGIWLAFASEVIQ